MNASRLKDLGYQLMDGLSRYYSESKIASSKRSWEYSILTLNEDFSVRFCEWRNPAMPAYIILYKRGKYILELDLSMLVFMNNSFTWYLKKGVNEKSKKAVMSILGPVVKLPEDYRERMLRNKIEANSGGDTPANGCCFVSDMDMDDIAVNLGVLFNVVIKAHGGTSIKNPKNKANKDAKNDDVNNKQLRAILIRQGQGEFRQNLLNAYKERCAITGWAPIEVLDACHIESHSVSGNNETRNGILLRTDLHNLFDRGLLKINHNNFMVEIDVSLEDTKYWSLNNKKLKSKFKPGVEYLKARYID